MVIRFVHIVVINDYSIGYCTTYPIVHVVMAINNTPFVLKDIISYLRSVIQFKPMCHRI